jgi:hypothetical protein
MTALDDGAETLAKALRPPAHGWGALAEPCQGALLELVAAGWTPPGSEGCDEQKRPRAETGRLSARLGDLSRHLDRLATEEMAFREFRGLLVQVAHPAGRNPLGLDPGRDYSASEVQAWVVRLLDVADRRAERARRQVARNAAERQAKRERVQLALFAPEPVLGDCGDGYAAQAAGGRTVETVAVAGGLL